MTDHDHLSDDPTATRGPIRVDLAGLARAMPDDPDRVGRVLAGAARHRRHRQAARAVAGAALAAATVGGLIAVRTNAPGRATSAAGAATDSTVATTLATQPAGSQVAVSCSVGTGPDGPTIVSGVGIAGGVAGPVPAPGPVRVQGGVGVGTDTGPNTAEVVAGAAGVGAGGAGGAVPVFGSGTGPRVVTGAVPGGEPGAGEPADRVTMMKGLAAVTAVDDTSISVTLDEGMAPPDTPSSITASFTEQTLYRDGDAPASTRPVITVGDKVLIAVEQTAGAGARVLELVAHPSLESAGPGTMAVGAVGAMAVTEKVQGDITAVDGDSVTVTVAEGSLPVGQSVVVHIPTPTAAAAIGTPCGPPPAPSVGDHGSFLLGAPNADGSYPAVLVELRHG